MDARGVLWGISLFLAFSSCRHTQSTSTPREFRSAREQGDWEKPENVVPFKLAVAEAQGIEQVTYRVPLSWLDGDEFEAEDEQFYYLVKFPTLTAAQFAILHAAYGGMSEVVWQQGKAYYLEDFLPPVMQALLEKRFLATFEKLAPYPKLGNKKIFLNGTTHCFTAAYEAARRPRDQTYGFYIQSSRRVEELLENDKTSTLLYDYFPTSPDPSVDVQKREQNLTFGDLLMVYRNLDNGKQSQEHAAIYIDHDLFFEKTGPGDIHAYRFVLAADILSHYQGSTKWRYRRFDKGPLPSPDQVVSVQVTYPDHPIVKLLPVDLQKELIFESEKPDSISFFHMPVLKLQKNPQTGRYALQKEARQKNFFRLKQRFDAAAAAQP